ncbi:MAG TPA: hypothetical protein VF711_00735, partial [Acidimicrobiales bacterium]
MAIATSSRRRQINQIYIALREPDVQLRSSVRKGLQLHGKTDDIPGHAPPHEVAQNSKFSRSRASMEEPIIARVLRVRVVLTYTGDAEKRLSGFWVQEERVSHAFVESIERLNGRRSRLTTTWIDELETRRPYVVVVVRQTDRRGHDRQLLISECDRRQEADLDRQIPDRQEYPPPAAIHLLALVPLVELLSKLSSTDLRWDELWRQLRRV